MTLNDLKTGMIVTTRNGFEFTVIRDMAKPYENESSILVYVRECSRNTCTGKGWMHFNDYNNDLTYNKKSRDWDIVKVETANHPFGFMDITYQKEMRQVIWKETSSKKLTVSEIEKLLGYKVEIVSEE